MSCRLQCLLEATNGGSGNTSFIRSVVCSVCRCLQMIRPMLGSARKNVITSGILSLRSKFVFSRRRSSLFLVSTFTNSVSANAQSYPRFTSCALTACLCFR
ncbi:hypothetical protein DPMN_044275 [Dreissena polymorpha]|uniref:Uncharacterized protein n=1 Tax=Dreissena polymorpha TaxID=45954 RepID=A0A9D4D3W1_DREPO|nr:hypothetical protein DPMN_044275 [Dreissena polymorpha]